MNSWGSLFLNTSKSLKKFIFQGNLSQMTSQLNGCSKIPWVCEIREGALIFFLLVPHSQCSKTTWRSDLSVLATKLSSAYSDITGETTK